MIKDFNGQQYYDLIDCGIRNLAAYKDRVNELNVFPVPDGDTGTNMLVTLQCGLSAVPVGDKVLSDVCNKFAKAVTFGARGNSGVIVSQFFKGISDHLSVSDTADFTRFVSALDHGVKCAYHAVPQPVEGTILTVVREASEYVKCELDKGKVHSLNDVLAIFLSQARHTLESTPELLDVLKSAGVVDSGGAGIIYVFEGMSKYLNNEALPELEETSSNSASDYTRFHRDSTFDFGYCTELLLQLLNVKSEFDYPQFLKTIAEYGDSLVTVLEDDKLKLHIHTKTPENVMAFCHQYGEFLSLKIENMSVQHQELYTEEKDVAPYGEGNPFAVVAVAHNSAMEQYFSEMGADYVMLADYQNPPAASDFMDAFALAVPDTIFVFPNNKNTELAAIQAQRLCETKNIRVLATRSDAQCFASLPMIEFACEDPEEVMTQVEEVINNLDIALVSKVEKTTNFDGKPICEGDFVSISNNSLKAVSTDLAETCIQTIRTILADRDCEVITMFRGQTVSDEVSERITSFVSDNYMYTEITVVDTDDEFYHVVLSFE